MPANASKRYPPELKERAVRTVAEVRAEHESEWAAMTKVAQLLGVTTPETVRQWVRQAEVDQGARAGVSTEESAKLKRLKREVAELRRANSILQAGLTGAVHRPEMAVACLSVDRGLDMVSFLIERSRLWRV
jgi:transposase